MTIGCNIWMICLKLNRFFYGLSRMLHLSELVWILRSSVLIVFNNFLLIDATDRSKIISDQKRVFIALSLYPLSFFANTPFKSTIYNLFTYISCFEIRKICLKTWTLSVYVSRLWSITPEFSNIHLLACA